MEVLIGVADASDRANQREVAIARRVLLAISRVLDYQKIRLVLKSSRPLNLPKPIMLRATMNADILIFDLVVQDETHCWIR